MGMRTQWKGSTVGLITIEGKGSRLSMAIAAGLIINDTWIARR
jgi:hypothetical protein